MRVQKIAFPGSIMILAALPLSVHALAPTPTAYCEGDVCTEIEPTESSYPSASCNTASVRPVVFVPGTGGSELIVDQSGYNPGESSVWWDDSKDPFLDDKEIVYNLSMTYKETGTSTYKGMRPLNPDVSAAHTTGTATNGYWDGLIDKQGQNCPFEQCSFQALDSQLGGMCYQNGKTLFSANYHWLDDWSKACDLVEKTIDQALAANKSDKVHLMGHSQGTQIIDACLTYYKKGNGIQNKVASVTHFAPLYTGVSPKLTWYNMIPGYAGYPFIGEWYGGVFVSSEDTSKVARYAPALYLMAPTSKYESVLQSNYGIRSSYKVTRYDMNTGKTTYNPSSNSNAHSFAMGSTYDAKSTAPRQLVNLTDGLHKEMDNTNNKYDIPLLVIRGLKHQTVVSIDNYCTDITLGGVKSTTCLPLETSKEGDKTVPALSSWSANNNRSKQGVQVVNIYENEEKDGVAGLKAEHTAMISDSTSIQNIFRKYVQPFIREKAGYYTEASGKNPKKPAVLSNIPKPFQPGAQIPDLPGLPGLDKPEDKPEQWDSVTAMPISLAKADREHFNRVYGFSLPLANDLAYTVTLLDKATGQSLQQQFDSSGEILETNGLESENCMLRHYVFSAAIVAKSYLASFAVEEAESTPKDTLSIQVRIPDLQKQDQCELSIDWTGGSSAKPADLLARLKNLPAWVMRYDDKPDLPKKSYGFVNMGAGALKLAILKNGNPSLKQAGKPVKFLKIKS